MAGHWPIGIGSKDKDIEFCKTQYNIEDNIPLCGSMLAPMHEGDRPNLTEGQKQHFNEQMFEMIPGIGDVVTLASAAVGKHLEPIPIGDIVVYSYEYNIFIVVDHGSGGKG